MNIAIAIPEGDVYDRPPSYQLNCALSLCTSSKEHTLFLISSKSEFERLSNIFMNKNVVILPIIPLQKKGWKLWYYRHVKLPQILRKSGVSIYLSEDHETVNLSLKRQIVLLSEADENKKHQLVQKLQRADFIITATEYARDMLKKWNEDFGQQSLTVQPGADDFESCSHEKSVPDFIKQKTGDKEYFFCMNADVNYDHCISILKAFSIFKKFQQSGIKLVFLTDAMLQDQLASALLNYKYREDVLLLNSHDPLEIDAFLSNAYANIIIKRNYGLYESMMRSLQSGVPLLLPEHPNLFSAFGENVLYFKMTEQDIAQKIMMIYKDETLKKKFQYKGLELAKNNKWKKVIRPLVDLMTSTESQ